jgi:hypothetical protein
MTRARRYALGAGRLASFVFDLMEPERPRGDLAVLVFLKSEALYPEDFTIRADGVVRLNPELARQVTAIVSLLPPDYTGNRAV